MGEGQHYYMDKELDKAVENLRDLGNFNTKREASKRAGEILNAGLKSMKRKIEEEIHEELTDEKAIPAEDQGFDFSSIGFE